MEPVTHILTGAVLARAGFNRKAAYATAAMAIAAELPDIDTLWSLGGPVTGLMHHRGITHTLVGIPFEAAAMTGFFWAWNRWRRRATKVPFSATWLGLGTLVALLSHLLLDWTNDYGLRPFFPFDPHWYAGSFVFIFEPVLFAILVAALVLPSLFGLINSEVGAGRPAFRGRPSAILALLAVAALYGFRYVQRDRAVALASDALAADPATAQFDRVMANPYPVDPFRWHVVAATPDATLLSTVDTRRGIATLDERLARPAASLALLAAKRTELGRVYLDWSMFPLLSEVPVAAAGSSGPARSFTQVTFSDARFLYDTFLLRGRNRPPLTGSVTLDLAAPEGQRVVEMRMDGREQR